MRASRAMTSEADMKAQQLSSHGSAKLSPRQRFLSEIPADSSWRSFTSASDVVSPSRPLNLQALKITVPSKAADTDAGANPETLSPSSVQSPAIATGNGRKKKKSGTRRRRRQQPFPRRALWNWDMDPKVRPAEAGFFERALFLAKLPRALLPLASCSLASAVVAVLLLPGPRE